MPAESRFIKKSAPDPAPGRSVSSAGRILQRKCACGGTPGPTGECEACRKKKLQRRPGTLPASSSINHLPSPAAQVPPIVQDVLRSTGRPLDQETRALMEPRFGRDFSRVRVHTDTPAAESARAVNALAYTVAPNVVFGQGQYAPGTTAGRELLAHELTHVVQQKDVSFAPRAALRIGPPNDALEEEADATASQFTSADPIATPQRCQSNAIVNRKPASDENRAPQAGGQRSPGAPLPYREATELAECIRIMGAESADYCRERVLGEKPLPAPAKAAGSFKVGMTPFVTGLKGTIEFTPDPDVAPKCNLIRLVQVVRVFEKPGQDYKWPGKEKPREKVKTKEDTKKGVKANYFVDHKAASCSKGTACSIYYRDHWANAVSSQDGSNDGTIALAASLWDIPTGDAGDTFEFETCARCDDNGAYLHCVNWGFSADSTGTVTAAGTSEHAAPSATFVGALATFNKYYRNK